MFKHKYSVPTCMNTLLLKRITYCSLSRHPSPRTHLTILLPTAALPASQANWRASTGALKACRVRENAGTRRESDMTMAID